MLNRSRIIEWWMGMRYCRARSVAWILRLLVDLKIGRISEMGIYFDYYRSSSAIFSSARRRMTSFLLLPNGISSPLSPLFSRWPNLGTWFWLQKIGKALYCFFCLSNTSSTLREIVKHERDQCIIRKDCCKLNKIKMVGVSKETFSVYGKLRPR